MIQLDATDIRLINELQTDSKQSIKQLAEKINLSITPTHERIKKIEASGIIKKYVAILDHEKVGKKFTVFCQVTLIKHQESSFKEFEKYIEPFEEIQEVSYIAGNYDYLLKIVLNDMKDYQDFIMRKISQLKVISNIQSSFVINQIKTETKISLE
ncbi:Lrp/AsnC family transcriptional regulator [Urechidicola sp. KH5]